ncbi:epoxide hydrolase [Moniliophthora roreri]|nr:epoxide hydrolase [Moniliophthora roreri]
MTISNPEFLRGLSLDIALHVTQSSFTTTNLTAPLIPIPSHSSRLVFNVAISSAEDPKDDVHGRWVPFTILEYVASGRISTSWCSPIPKPAPPYRVICSVTNDCLIDLFERRTTRDARVAKARSRRRMTDEQREAWIQMAKLLYSQAIKKYTQYAKEKADIIDSSGSDLPLEFEVDARWLSR